MRMLLRRRMLLTALIEFIQHLFYEGDKCADITGGWMFNQLEGTNNTGTGSFNTFGGVGCMLFSATSTSGMNARRLNFLTNKKINTTGYKYLCMDWSSAETSDAGMSLGLYATNTCKELGYTARMFKTASKYNVRQIDKLDISSYQGSYYIGGFFYKAADTTNTYTGRIFRIWLE